MCVCVCVVCVRTRHMYGLLYSSLSTSNYIAVCVCWCRRSLCELIAENSQRWDWHRYPTSLCTGAPMGLEVKCQAMAMCLESCVFFRRGYCHIQSTPTTSEIAKPCPAMYLCEFCLNVISSNTAVSRLPTPVFALRACPVSRPCEFT